MIGTAESSGVSTNIAGSSEIARSE